MTSPSPQRGWERGPDGEIKGKDSVWRQLLVSRALPQPSPPVRGFVGVPNCHLKAGERGFEMNPSEKLGDAVDSCMCNLKHVAWGWLAVLTEERKNTTTLGTVLCPQFVRPSMVECFQGNRCGSSAEGTGMGLS